MTIKIKSYKFQEDWFISQVMELQKSGRKVFLKNCQAQISDYDHNPVFSWSMGRGEGKEHIIIIIIVYVNCYFFFQVCLGFFFYTYMVESTVL